MTRDYTTMGKMVAIDHSIELNRKKSSAIRKMRREEKRKPRKIRSFSQIDGLNESISKLKSEYIELIKLRVQKG